MTLKRLLVMDDVVCDADAIAIKLILGKVQSIVVSVVCLLNEASHQCHGPPLSAMGIKRCRGPAFDGAIQVMVRQDHVKIQSEQERLERNIVLPATIFKAFSNDNKPAATIFKMDEAVVDDAIKFFEWENARLFSFVNYVKLCKRLITYTPSSASISVGHNKAKWNGHTTPRKHNNALWKDFVSGGPEPDTK